MVRIRRVSTIRVCDSDQCGAYDLDHRCHDVAGDEYPQDELWAERRVVWPVWRGLYQHREYGVDGCGEEDGRNYDEEVLDYKVGDAVGVAFGAEGARDIANYFLSSTVIIFLWR